MPVQVEQRLGRNIKTSTLYTKEELDLIFGGNIAAAGEAVGRQSELDSRLTTLNDVELPNLQTQLDTLDGYFVDPSTIPAGYSFFTGIVAEQAWIDGLVANQAWLDNLFVNNAFADRITANEIFVGTLAAIATNTGSLTVSDWIRSSNYSAGSAGFSINSAGNAEFNDIDVRGGLIRGGTMGGFTVSGDRLFNEFAGGGYIEMYNVDSTQSRFLVTSDGDLSAGTGNFILMRHTDGDMDFQARVGGEVKARLGSVDNFVAGLNIAGTLTMDANGVITNTAGDYTITESGFFIKTNSSYISERAFNIGDDVGLYGAFWGSSTEVILEAFAGQNRPLKLNANANELRTRFGSDDVDYQSASSTGTTGSTRSGWIRIEINGATRFIRTYTEP